MKVVPCRRCKKPYHQLEDPKDAKGMCLKCLTILAGREKTK